MGTFYFILRPNEGFKYREAQKLEYRDMGKTQVQYLNIVP